MELSQAVVQKQNLEKAIIDAIVAFEKETSLTVSGVGVEHKYLTFENGTRHTYSIEVKAEINL